MMSPITPVLHELLMIRILIVLACLLSTACVSSGHATDLDEPVRLELTSYARNGFSQFVLINEAHTSRVEQYSNRAGNANTKVASNEAMQDLLDVLQDNGFFELAVSGTAPEATNGKALELELKSGTTQWYVSLQDPKSTRDTFTRCYKPMIDLWNNIFAAQSVENSQGEAVFGKQRRTQ